MIQTARPDIYVALLGIALGAIVLGCLFLILVMNRYGFKRTVSATTPSITTSRTLMLAASTTIIAPTATVHL
jgi:hypothetical protein